MSSQSLVIHQQLTRNTFNVLRLPNENIQIKKNHIDSRANESFLVKSQHQLDLCIEPLPSSNSNACFILCLFSLVYFITLLLVNTHTFIG